MALVVEFSDGDRIVLDDEARDALLAAMDDLGVGADEAMERILFAGYMELMEGPGPWTSP